MKKVKIMLMSLALLAIVGGALAFKAKYTQNFCTSTAYSDASGYYCSYRTGTPPNIVTITQKCPNEVVNSVFFKDADDDLNIVCTTDVNVNGDCTNQTTCDNVTFTINVDGI